MQGHPAQSLSLYTCFVCGAGSEPKSSTRRGRSRMQRVKRFSASTPRCTGTDMPLQSSFTMWAVCGHEIVSGRALAKIARGAAFQRCVLLIGLLLGSVSGPVPSAFDQASKPDDLSKSTACRWPASRSYTYTLRSGSGPSPRRWVGRAGSSPCPRRCPRFTARATPSPSEKRWPRSRPREPVGRHSS